MKKNYTKALMAGLVLVAVILIFRFSPLMDYLSFDQIKARGADIKQYAQEHYWLSVIGYILAYAAMIAGTLPIVAPLTMLGAFVFGFAPALLYATIASTAGALFSFLMLRAMVRHGLAERYGQRLASFNEKIKKYGYWYLLALQVMMIFPFIMINTLAALADVPIITFIWTTALGSLPYLAIYAYAGGSLAEMKSASDIFKPEMLIIFGALGLLFLLPMVIKKIRGDRSQA